MLRCLALLILVSGALLPLPAMADAPGFARVDSDANGRPRALQVAIARYTSSHDGQDVSVDLISAIHIGDQEYYAGLNRRFLDYDALLFELILPAPLAENEDEEPVSLDRGFISGMQIEMKNTLGMSFQLDEIDYGAANFVHADLYADELQASMTERGESLYVYFWRLIYAAFDDYARDPLGLQQAELLGSALMGGDYALRTALAAEMVRGTQRGDILGGDLGSAVIVARNERALEVMDEVLADGQRAIGIFYGAAHMPDFHARLLERGFRLQEIEWVDAWRLQDEAASADAAATAQ